MTYERVVVRARQALTFNGPDVGLIEDAAIHVSNGDVVWVGPSGDAPEFEGRLVQAQVVCPAWVDCHTHSIFGGARHGDFARRNAGETYAAILEAGGGIMSTVSATRAASDQELEQTLSARLRAFYATGVSTVEVKTGYGLDFDEELRHLMIIARVAQDSPVDVIPTCLAAHTVPAEWRSNRAGYLDMVCDELLPEVARQGLAEQVDVFCDRGAFDVIESRRVLETARDLGFSLRVHAEELARTGATQLACELGARSADHLEHISSEDVQAMAHADVAAVLLPLVTAFLDLPERAPARELANAGVRIAVSTDYNPGSAHSISMQLALSLACSLHKLSPAEGLRGVTRVPAEIVGRPLAGIIKQGAPADLLEFDVSSWDAIPYFMTDAPMTRLPL
ncbi:MAG: imidazolonepropionase [Bradymonadia bacterium]